MFSKVTKVTSLKSLKKVTVIYYDDESLILKHYVGKFPAYQGGRVILPESFKNGKSIIALCEGSVNIMNSVGERIESYYQFDSQA